MTNKLKKLLCRECGLPLVMEDNGGNLTWGTHESWCTAKHPFLNSPGLKSAKAKLVCGGECKHHLYSQISDLGNIAICKNCPNEALARESVDAHVIMNGKKKPVEVVYPAIHLRPPQ